MSTQQRTEHLSIQLLASRLSIPDNLIVSQYNGVKVHALMEKGRRCHPNVNQLTMAAMESSQPAPSG